VKTKVEPSQKIKKETYRDKRNTNFKTVILC